MGWLTQAAQITAEVGFEPRKTDTNLSSQPLIGCQCPDLSLPLSSRCFQVQGEPACFMRSVSTHQVLRKHTPGQSSVGGYSGSTLSPLCLKQGPVSQGSLEADTVVGHSKGSLGVQLRKGLHHRPRSLLRSLRSKPFCIHQHFWGCPWPHCLAEQCTHLPRYLRCFHWTFALKSFAPAPSWANGDHSHRRGPANQSLTLLLPVCCG